MIELSRVGKEFGSCVALSEVSLNVDEGEFVFITGSSGSGKTTLVRLLIADEFPETGFIKVDGLHLVNATEDQLRSHRRRIGVVFQDYGLLADKTAYENVAFALRCINIEPASVHRRTLEALATVGMGQSGGAYPEELSAGMQQRVAIARAIVTRPRMVLADEPTGNVDPKNTVAIMEILDAINRTGTTVIVTTHDPLIVEIMQRRVVLLERGRVRVDDVGGYRV
ncbi:MAG: ATP-binding cassette domain-containing protein [Actinobacteria bacterium]|nr:MAG: ATP-binding cassette domain-containing protein [Actinomycetota bacterium]